MILGASFDPPADNKAFAEAQRFGFRLLSDVDRAVATSYLAVRPRGDQYEAFPERFSYLIDPEGVVRKVYRVADVKGHAAEVLHDLAVLQGRS